MFDSSKLPGITRVHNRRWLWMVMTCLLVLVWIVGCSRAEEATPTNIPGPTDEPTVTDEPSPTAAPTETTRPSATPTPEPTESPTPEPTETVIAAGGGAGSGSSSSSGNTQPAPSGTEPTDAPQAVPPTATTSGFTDFAPGGESVWQLDNVPSEFYSTEACPAPLVVDFYGLVAVTRISTDVLSWQVTNGTIYTLQRTTGNAFWGIGRSVYPEYALTVSVLFASPDGLGVTYSLLHDNVEGCAHVFQYGAFRAW